jgi:micrococcal nuclease
MDSATASQLLRILIVVVLLIGFGILILLSVRWGTRQRTSQRRLGRDPGPEIGEDALIPGQPIRLRSRLYYYAAYVTEVYDGDTLTVDVDLGLGVWRHNQTIRLWKVNTPEVRGPERAQGLQVRDFVRAQVLDKQILLRTILDKRGEDQTGKFGRLLGEILVEDESGEVINLNQVLLDQGMAQPMDEQGSKVTADTRDLSAPPDFVPCPFCGEIRAVDQDRAMILLCPNCLDPERSIF